MIIPALLTACAFLAVPSTESAAQAARKPAPARPTMTVTVTNMEGKPLAEVWVKASGPVDREGPTTADGSVIFRTMSAGAYRLRFEHDEYVTLERDVAMAARALPVTVALTAAPPPPPPPPDPPKIEPPPPPPLPAPGPPTSISIPDFVERNFVGGAPSLVSPMGCAPGATSSLFQLRDPLPQHTHEDADEMFYVVAGEGTHVIGGREYALSAGIFAVVPRGTAHSIVRRGGRPIIILSILSGQPCGQDTP